MSQPPTRGPSAAATPAPDAVAERAADEQETREHERVRLDDPLHVGDGRPELALERRQRDVDDGPIDEREARPQDRRREHPRARRVRTGLRAGGRKNYPV